MPLKLRSPQVVLGNPKPKSSVASLSKKIIFEKEAIASGFRVICGVDEVGRGCLAGPVVAGAVILSEEWETRILRKFKDVTDSKQLTEEEREKLSDLICKNALSFGIGIVEVDEIDRMNIHRASLKAMRLALEQMKLKPDFLLVDGRAMIPLTHYQQKTVVKGDLLSLSIGAASIIAKVHRDHLMIALDREYPQFGFSSHKGYATPEHYEAIQRYGHSKVHRLSFKGVQNLPMGF